MAGKPYLSDEQRRMAMMINNSNILRGEHEGAAAVAKLEGENLIAADAEAAKPRGRAKAAPQPERRIVAYMVAKTKSFVSPGAAGAQNYHQGQRLDLPEHAVLCADMLRDDFELVPIYG
jgi:hypothetical protein